ncbi:MAG: PorP/SprF family type IX secretion system membrane protein [Bacteroidota bacterium]
MRSWLQVTGYRWQVFRNPVLKMVLVFCIAVNCQLSTVNAQDIHFTQFFTNPLIINPAHTGYYDGNYRIGLNFKAQWPWAISNTTYNYHTETPYVDVSFGERKIKVGWMGIGFHFLNDEAGDGSLTYRRFGLSYAYHQALDKEHRYILSAGAAVTYSIRSVDFTKFYFNNQWVEDEGFDFALNSNEPVERSSFTMIDVSAGLNFGGQIHEQVKLDLGVSMLHLNRPKHTFFENDERLGFRYQASAGLKYDINDNFSVNVNGYYGYEKKASEIITGAMLGYSPTLNRSAELNHTFYIGGYYRVKDAFSPIAGYRFKGLRVLFNYDVVLSRLQKPGRANGGPEFSIVYVGKWGGDRYNGEKVYCPKFN